MRHFLVLALLLVAGTLFAFPQMFAGIEGGVNANSFNKDMAYLGVSGGLSFGWELSPNISIGMRAVGTSDFGTLFTMEEMALFRFYILPKGLFAQAELGASLYFGEVFQSKVLPLGAVCVGWRIPLGKTWFVEPVARGGFPFLWSGTLGGGLRF